MYRGGMFQSAAQLSLDLDQFRASWKEELSQVKEATGHSAPPRPVFYSASTSHCVTSTVRPGDSPSLTPGTPSQSPSAGFHSPARTMTAGSHPPEIERKRKAEKEPRGSRPPIRRSLTYRDCEASQDSVSQSP